MAKISTLPTTQRLYHVSHPPPKIKRGFRTLETIPMIERTQENVKKGPDKDTLNDVRELCRILKCNYETNDQAV
jgi:hypothetical protein